jgi:hypothetical protein
MVTGVFSVIPAHAGIQDRLPCRLFRSRRQGRRRYCRIKFGVQSIVLPESSTLSTERASCLVPRMCAAHPCRAVSGAARSSLQFTMAVVFIGYESQARMSPAGRNTSLAPDSVAALSCSVVTDRSWGFAGMAQSPPTNRSEFLAFVIAHTELRAVTRPCYFFERAIVSVTGLHLKPTVLRSASEKAGRTWARLHNPIGEV